MSAIYLYGFAPPDTELPEDGLLGVDDALVERVVADEMAAIISRVSAERFCREAIEEDAGDVERMADLGLAHEQVVTWLVDHAVVVPARLLTVFSSESALRRVMASDAGRIRSELERLDGLREWDVRVESTLATLVARIAEVSEEVAALDREIEAAGPGRRFLLEKKRADMTRTEARAAATRMAREILDSLRGHAVESVTLEPPSDAEPGALNAALLVARSEEPALADAVAAERERVEPLGFTVECTGPWAPYRFTGDRDG